MAYKIIDHSGNEHHGTLVSNKPTAIQHIEQSSQGYILIKKRAIEALDLQREETILECIKTLQAIPKEGKAINTYMGVQIAINELKQLVK